MLRMINVAITLRRDEPPFLRVTFDRCHARRSRPRHMIMAIAFIKSTWRYCGLISAERDGYYDLAAKSVQFTQ